MQGGKKAFQLKIPHAKRRLAPPDGCQYQHWPTMSTTTLGTRVFYVVDTNIIVDYVNILPGSYDYEPEEPTIDLRGAHLVIPTAVIRELSSFKKEKNDRGKAARIALRRLREMFEGWICDIEDVYSLQAPLLVTEREQLVSVMPVHKNFKDCLPFNPSDDDMDGQIILATMAVAFAAMGLPIDGTASKRDVMRFSTRRMYAPNSNNFFKLGWQVVLLTNDNGLAIRARERGLMTERYGYKLPEPYTGRRDVVVPKEIFNEFYNTQRIDIGMWEEYMPLQPKLVANEFIIMTLKNEDDYPRDYDSHNDPYFCNIGKYDTYEKAIVKLKYANKFPVRLQNAGQAIYAEALMDPHIAAVLCRGPAGSGKTYMATVYGYNACKNGDYIGVTVVPCESRSDLGALPGDLDDKMDPQVQPIKNALRNYILKEDSKLRKDLENLRKFGTKNDGDEHEGGKSLKQRMNERVDLIWSNWFSNIPIEDARGRDFSHELAIYDEFQDQTTKQADTLIKRLGEDGKIVITGDINQIHAPYIDAASSGLEFASRQLYDIPLVAQVCFTEEEVVRHQLVKLIAHRQHVKKG